MTRPDVPRELSPGRRRVLAMLDQRGPLHRHEIGYAFAKTNRMWSQAATRLAGSLCRPLLDAKLIEERCDRDGYHQHMAITVAGRRALRDTAPREAGDA